MLEPTSFLKYVSHSLVTIEGDSVFIVSTSSMPTSASPKARQEFDYASLDAETYRFVKQQTGEIRVLMKRTVESIVEIGQRLIAVKQSLGHGSFGAWLETEFDWDERTARRFMSVAESFKDNSDNLSEINFAPSALYILAAPSTPEAARTEALIRAKAGESITYTAAKAIKQKYATPTTPKLEPPQPSVKPVSQPPLIPALSLQPRSQLEIVAIHRQTQPSVEADLMLTIPQPPVSEPDVPGVWWQLGGKHLLYCGDPNSSEFLGRITIKVSLLFAFPSTPNWQPSMQVSTRFILETLPEEKNIRLFEDTLESILLLCSNIGDLVVSCFLPSPEILSVINRHSRRGLFAEPDSKRVAAVISNWKGAGLKVERVN